MTDEAVPPAALLLRDFVNTYEPQVDDESLTTPDALRDWLAARGLLPGGAHLRPADLTVAVTVREGLRAVLLSHAGHTADPAAGPALDRVLAGVPVRVSVDGGGFRLVAVRGAAIDRAMAGLLDAIRQCREEHTWTRLKVCDRATCRWAYYDASRNQARRWCSMAGCGNYVKMRRAYAVRTGRDVSPSDPSR
jgi:predicted RNA-binding Zn ribbon-like protein